MDARSEELWVANCVIDVVVEFLTIIVCMLRTEDDEETVASVRVGKAVAELMKAKTEI